jgi:predicted lipoprotein
MKLISKAIRSLYPTAEFVIENEDYTRIRWIKNQPENFVSKDQLDAEADRLTTVERSLEYQAKRRLEYPPMGDYLDAVYWQSQGDESKMAAYLAAVEAVKYKYPKD